MVQLGIDHREIERRKQFYRDVFDYRPVDHLPVYIWMMGFQGEGASEYTLRSELESLELQFEVNVRAIRRALSVVPDDYIPTVRITQGYMTIATMFGMGVHWSDDPNQPPGSYGHIIHDLEQVYSLRRPTMDDGIMPENLRRLRYFHQNLPGDVYLTGIDNGGPLNNLKDLLDTNLLYLGFYDNRLYAPWGSGGFHNCGPNPCLPLYAAHTPRVKYLNCSYRFSRADFPQMREVFAGWGIVEPMFDMGESAEEMLDGYRAMMETLAPDTIAIPYCIVDDTWSDGDITAFYWDMRKIAEEYAANMRWVGESS